MTITSYNDIGFSASQFYETLTHAIHLKMFYLCKNKILQVECSQN